PEKAGAIAKSAGIEVDSYGFCQTQPFQPVETSRRGVYVCGAFAEPKDIPDSVIEAGGAAAAALATIGQARGTLVVPPEYPPEAPVSPEEEPRVGVFICSCG
ncbi:MAG: FAD-dependent oxidoreductase, partial [Anaerolineae bacterium]|nr:FAD-dependent oxidoreductase [Anaerolineae bacterium]